MAVPALFSSGRPEGREAATLLAALLIAGLAATAVADPPPASQPARSIPVVEYGASLRTAQGGFYHSVGGRPDMVRDQLLQIGQPAVWAWRVDVSAGAPDSGLGAVVPLFDNTAAARPEPLDISAARFLELRLIGTLGQRRLRVEISPQATEEATSWVTVTTLGAAELDAGRWKNVVVRALAESAPSAQVGMLRLMLEGTGPGWLAVERIRFCDSEQPADWAPTKTSEPRPLRQALWVWSTNEILADRAEIDALVEFSRQHGITDLYCQIPYVFEGGAVQLKLADAQRALNTAAHQAKIRVHALDGAAPYALAANHERMFKLVAALDQFNQAGPATGRYDAVHLDNEPYVLPEWKDTATRQKVIDGFIELNRELRKRVNAAKMDYGIDIPFWFDLREKSGGPTFPVETPDGKVTLLEALCRCVQNIGIMSYRERATGPNGVVALCLTEFELGTRLGVEVFPAVELGTGPNVEDGITLGRYPPEYVQQQLETLRRALAFQSGCAGLAIHYYDPYRAMETTR